MAAQMEYKRIPVRARVLPDQYDRALTRATELGVSLSAYVGLLVDRDTADLVEERGEQMSLGWEARKAS